VSAAVRLGLAGAGAWGRNYIRTIGSLPGIRLACVASRNPETAKIVPPTCAVLPDWRALLDPGLVDGVIIATPTPTHVSIALAAIERGLPVLVEKPLTMDLAEARTLKARAAEKQACVMVEHTQLFHPAYRELKSRLPALGRLKELRAVAGRTGPFRADTPVLWDWGSHDVAMCLDLIGTRPISIAARVAERATVEGHEGESIQINLGFPSGIAASLFVSNVLREKTRRFTAVGERGSLTYDDTAPASEPPLTIAVREFAEAIATHSRDDSSLKLAVGVVEVLSACASALASAQ
jgi:predicted dehydrogenase